MTRLLAAAVAVLFAAAVHAQLRALPAQAKAGKMRHVQESVVQIDGQLARLAPGAQIRDAHNRIVMPASVPADSLVRYMLNAEGQVSAAWILAPQEIGR
ncbi:MAG: hypothetical protein AB7S87_03960 [Burkholderiales bacterium]